MHEYLSADVMDKVHFLSNPKSLNIAAVRHEQNISLSQPRPLPDDKSQARKLPQLSQPIRIHHIKRIKITKHII